MITIQTYRNSRNVGIRIHMPFGFELDIFIGLHKK